MFNFNDCKCENCGELFNTHIDYADVKHDDDGSINFCRKCVDLENVNGLIKRGFEKSHAHKIVNHSWSMTSETLSYEEAEKLLIMNDTRRN